LFFADPKPRNDQTDLFVTTACLPDTASVSFLGVSALVLRLGDLDRLLFPLNFCASDGVKNLVLPSILPIPRSHAYWRTELSAKPDIIATSLIVSFTSLSFSLVSFRGLRCFLLLQPLYVFSLLFRRNGVCFGPEQVTGELDPVEQCSPASWIDFDDFVPRHMGTIELGDLNWQAVLCFCGKSTFPLNHAR
jgi:hypothetical protein